MNAFDTQGYHWLNHFAGHHPVVDDIMAFFAQYALEMYAVLFIIAWFALPRRDTAHRHALVVSFCAGVLALLVNVIIGHIWVRARPFMVLPHGTFTQLIPHAPDASFPSDHTSGSFAFASGTWGKGPVWIQWLFTIIAVVTMVSRVYVGVHWPTDVIGGLVVGTVCGRITWRFSRFLEPISRRIIRMFRFGTR